MARPIQTIHNSQSPSVCPSVNRRMSENKNFSEKCQVNVFVSQKRTVKKLMFLRHSLFQVNLFPPLRYPILRKTNFDVKTQTSIVARIRGRNYSVPIFLHEQTDVKHRANQLFTYESLSSNYIRSSDCDLIIGFHSHSSQWKNDTCTYMFRIVATKAICLCRPAYASIYYVLHIYLCIYLPIYLRICLSVQ